MKRSVTLLLMLISFIGSCYAIKETPVPGSWRINDYRQLIEGKHVAIVANQTSMVDRAHLVDTLVSLEVKVDVIFAPEHGFREMADAGATIENGRDPVTGIRIISLYGNHKKPLAEDLEGIDIVLFDIQDVGARFYTYISTLHYVLEACAQNGVKVLVLDRPNPNGFYVDGNILDTAYKSFVGMHPVPVVHGMTIGEYALMINGEGWLSEGIKCDLTVIACHSYTHHTMYELPVRPSPNLPNQVSVYLYPSLCFFEGTNISVGRGTAFPFQVFGSPLLPDRGFSFTPESLPGALNPPFLGIKCFGTDLRNSMAENIVPQPGLNLDWIIAAYRDYPQKENFFTSYFDVLAGGPVLRQQIQDGMTAKEIRKSWKDGLSRFAMVRKKYLLYK